MRWFRNPLPSICALCGAGCDAVVCPACAADYLSAPPPRCPRCANPLPVLPQSVIPAKAGIPFCGRCVSTPPSFDATITAITYAPPLDQLPLQLKFAHRLALAPWMSARLLDAILAHPDLPLPALLCPVPLGQQRLRERGFNQALELARPLAKRLGIPLQATLTLRTIDTPAQSSVAPDKRAANIKDAFIIAPFACTLVRGQHIGVVDDVMTSGHTLNELAATLKRFGAARVTNYVFARTPPHH